MKKLDIKLYLAGKITGNGEYKEVFAEAQKNLEIMGYIVVNPAEMGLDEKSHHDCMRILIPEMLSCSGIALLDNWVHSRGAIDEQYSAQVSGLPSAPVSWWIELAEKYAR